MKKVTAILTLLFTGVLSLNSYGITKKVKVISESSDLCSSFISGMSVDDLLMKDELYFTKEATTLIALNSALRKSDLPEITVLNCTILTDPNELFIIATPEYFYEIELSSFPKLETPCKKDYTKIEQVLDVNWEGIGVGPAAYESTSRGEGDLNRIKILLESLGLQYLNHQTIGMGGRYSGVYLTNFELGINECYFK